MMTAENVQFAIVRALRVQGAREQRLAQGFAAGQVGVGLGAIRRQILPIALGDRRPDLLLRRGHHHIGGRAAGQSGTDIGHVIAAVRDDLDSHCGVQRLISLHDGQGCGAAVGGIQAAIIKGERHRRADPSRTGALSSTFRAGDCRQQRACNETPRGQARQGTTHGQPTQRTETIHTRNCCPFACERMPAGGTGQSAHPPR